MSKTLAKLLCVAALSALAIPAFATDTQSTAQVAQGTPPASTTAPASPGGNTSMSPEEKAAKAACDAKTGPEKEKCLKDLEAKYGKSETNKMSAPTEAPKTGSTK